MKKEIAELREVISKLVPMLVGKKIKVTQQGSRAYVETDPRTNKPTRVNIPMVPDNAEPDFIAAVQGFIDHEVAHCLYTDWDEMFKAVGDPNSKKFNEKLASLANIMEDTMIERRILEVFPGARWNLEKLHSHFIEKITKPALASVKGDVVKEFERLMVPMTRALAGHVAFEEFMDKGGYWQHPVVEAIMKMLGPQNIAKFKKIKSTKEAIELARAMEQILYPPQPPQQGQGDSKDQQQDQSGKSQDKPDKKAGKGNGDGERDHSESEPSDGEEGDGDEADADSQPGKSGKNKPSKKDKSKDKGEDGDESEEKKDDKSKGKPNKKDKKEQDTGDGEGDDEGQSEDDAGDEGDGAGSDDADGQEDDQDGDSGEAGEGEEDEDGDEGKGAGGDDDEADDQDGEGNSDGSSDDDELEDDDLSGDGSDDGEDDEEDEGSGSGSVGDEDEDEDDGDQQGSKKPQQRKNEKIEAVNDGGEADPGETGDNSDSQGGGGGVGNGSIEKTVFDFADDAFEEADLSKQISIKITEAAKQALSNSDYNVFTREHDRIETLNVPDNMNQRWVVEMDEQVRSMTGKMQKDIERMMAAMSQTVRVPGLRSGRLHAPSLHRLKVNDDRVFSKKHEHKSKETAITLLIDNSGSMGGKKIELAMVAGYALASTLERVGMASEILGFTTGNANYYATHAEVQKDGGQFHRITPITMPIYKEFNERINSTVKNRIAYMAHAQVGMGANVDGESLEYAALRLVKRREQRKVILVLSDGAPSGAANAGAHLKKVAADVNKMGIDCVGIGIMDGSVRHYYDRSVVLNSAEQLPALVMNELRQILQK